MVKMVRLQVRSLVLKLRKMCWGRLLGAAPFHLRVKLSVKKALKQGLKPQKDVKPTKTDYTVKASTEKAMKAFKKMSGERGDLPL